MGLLFLGIVKLQQWGTFVWCGAHHRALLQNLQPGKLFASHFAVMLSESAKNGNGKV
jgi:hypothetical protein